MDYCIVVKNKFILVKYNQNMMKSEKGKLGILYDFIDIMFNIQIIKYVFQNIIIVVKNIQKSQGMINKRFNIVVNRREQEKKLD